MNTIKNNLFILSHVFKAAPLYTVGMLAYNAIRALVVVGDLWICKWVIGKLTYNNMEMGMVYFVNIAVLYGIYILLDYIGNQLNLLLLNWYGSIRSIDLSKYMRSLLYHKIEELELSCYERNDFYNDLGRVLNEIDTRPIQIVNSLAVGVYYLLTLILITVIILDPVFLFAGILIVIKHLLYVRRINCINYEMDRDTQPSMRRGQYIKELFRSREFIKEARLYEAEDFFIYFSERAAKEDYTISSSYNRKGSRHSFFMILFGNMVNMLIAAYLCCQMIAGKYVPGDFVYLINSFSAFTNNMSGLFQIFSEMQNHSMYIEIIRKVLDYQSPRTKQADQFKVKDIGAFEKITLEGVGFRYEEDGPTVLEDMDISIKKGEKVALVGENGSGKSTLVKMLLDFYLDYEGEILYNGIPYTHYDVNRVRGKFSAVFQDSPIYAFSIAENVLMRGLVSDSDEKLVVDALIFSGLWEKVNVLEKGIYTMVTKEFDEMGVYFSGGEYQKLIIARAYAHQSEILIFDEPASSLDPNAEYELFHKMMRLGTNKTVIYITHRLAATIEADWIYYIEKGKVQEKGTHTELMNLQGKYHQMFSVQMKGYK